MTCPIKTNNGTVTIVLDENWPNRLADTSWTDWAGLVMIIDPKNPTASTPKATGIRANRRTIIAMIPVTARTVVLKSAPNLTFLVVAVHPCGLLPDIYVRFLVADDT